MKFEKTTVTGIENAIIGADDMRIMQNLIKADGGGKAGEPNSKFLRMIHVQVAITAPLYWWKEFDTYKVGTTSNSTSTMHKLASTPITKECFEMDDFENMPPWNDMTSEEKNNLIRKSTSGKKIKKIEKSY